MNAVMSADAVRTGLAIFIVALLWGGTNPFLGQAADLVARSSKQSGGSRARSACACAIPYAINQLGSLLYHVLLGRSELTLVGPLTNALTAVVTGFVAAAAFNDRRALQPRALAGAALVCAGVALCVHAKVQLRDPLSS